MHNVIVKVTKDQICDGSVLKNVQSRARTNVVTFECSFVLVTFVSRFYVTKHSLNLIIS